MLKLKKKPVSERVCENKYILPQYFPGNITMCIEIKRRRQEEYLRELYGIKKPKTAVII